MVEEGRDLQDVLTQLKAVSCALDRAGFAIIAAEMRAAVGRDGVSEADLERLEHVFLSFA